MFPIFCIAALRKREYPPNIGRSVRNLDFLLVLLLPSPPAFSLTFLGVP